MRPFRSDEVAAVVELWAACELLRPWIDPRREIAIKQAHQPEGFWVAEHDGVVVGTVIAGFDGRRGWLNYLAVAPTWRGRGLGAHLVRVAEDDLAGRGCPKVNLQVRRDNAAATGFYEALGYVDDEVVTLGRRLDGGAGVSRS